ncbi:ABC transporter permease [Thalassotalea fusca]
MIWINFAWRNFVRNTRKSYFNLLIVLIGMLACIIAIGYMKATFMLVKEGTIRGGMAHLQIAKQGTFDGYEESPMQFGLSKNEVAQIEIVLRNDANVEFILPRIKFQGLISKGSTSLVFIGDGVSPNQERKLAQNFINTVSGKGLEYAPDGDMYNIVIGSDMARLLGAAVGDNVTLMAVTEFGGINAIDVNVFGISTSGSPEVDKIQLYAPIELAQNLILTEKISRLAIKLTNDEVVSATQTSLSNTISPLVVRNWQQLSPFYDQMISLYVRQFTVFGVIIAIVVVLTMLNAMLMSLYERKREFATMLSIGISPLSVKSSCVYEGVYIGLLASVLGIVIGAGVCELINLAGINMPPPPGRSQGYQLMVLFDMKATALVCAILVGLCAIAAWLAASKINNMTIVEAINHA